MIDSILNWLEDLLDRLPGWVLYLILGAIIVALLSLLSVSSADAQSYRVSPSNTGGYIITPHLRRKAHTPIDQWYFPSTRPTYVPSLSTYVPVPQKPTKHPALAWIPDSSTAWAKRDQSWRWVQESNRRVYRKVTP